MHLTEDPSASFRRGTTVADDGGRWFNRQLYGAGWNGGRRSHRARGSFYSSNDPRQGLVEEAGGSRRKIEGIEGVFWSRQLFPSRRCSVSAVVAGEGIFYVCKDEVSLVVSEEVWETQEEDRPVDGGAAGASLKRAAGVCSSTFSFAPKRRSHLQFLLPQLEAGHDRCPSRPDPSTQHRLHRCLRRRVDTRCSVPRQRAVSPSPSPSPSSLRRLLDPQTIRTSAKPPFLHVATPIASAPTARASAAPSRPNAHCCRSSLSTSPTLPPSSLSARCPLRGATALHPPERCVCTIRHHVQLPSPGHAALWSSAKQSTGRAAGPDPPRIRESGWPRRRLRTAT
jgi:hypothetical protein